MRQDVQEVAPGWTDIFTIRSHLQTVNRAVMFVPFCTGLTGHYNSSPATKIDLTENIVAARRPRVIDLKWALTRSPVLIPISF